MTMTATTNIQQEHTELSSLNDLRLRKELLRKDIESDEKQMRKLWRSIFTRPQALSKQASTSKRISSLISMGAGALDGAILAWKLYHKFKKK